MRNSAVQALAQLGSAQGLAPFYQAAVFYLDADRRQAAVYALLCSGVVEAAGELLSLIEVPMRRARLKSPAELDRFKLDPVVTWAVFAKQLSIASPALRLKVLSFFATRNTETRDVNYGRYENLK